MQEQSKTNASCLGHWDFYFDSLWWEHLMVVFVLWLWTVVFCSCSDSTEMPLRFIRICLYSWNPLLILFWLIYQYLFLLIYDLNMTSAYIRPSAEGATGLIIYHSLLFFCLHLSIKWH